MKAHSERIPNKNMRRFAGRPLFHYILETLEKTFAVDQVVVNTDSERIASEAEKMFSKVRAIPRPKPLQGDLVSMNDIIAYDITQVPSDVYLQTHSTNPLLRSRTIRDALNAFCKSEEHDSLFSVNCMRTRLYFADGRPVNHDPDKLIRTQDLPPVYEENSCLYVFTAESFRQAGGRRIGLKPMMFEIDRIEAVDIDDEYTFSLAETLARYSRAFKGRS